MSGFSSAPANEGPANQPELLEEVELDEGDALSDNDDMSTIMGDDDDENIEKQMMNENGQGQGKEGAMDAIGEEDDMANVVFRGHSDAVYCGVNHPTVPGLVLTGGGDDNAFLWRFPITSNLIDSSEQVDIETVIPLEGHTDTVTSVGFNFDGTMALTGSYDGTVRIWKADTGEFLRTLEGPEDVEWASWHSKGNAVIAGSKDGTVWMWLAHNGQCMQVFAGHEGAVACGMFSSDGKVICTGGEDGTLRVWAPKTGACKHVFDNIHEGLVTSISVSTKDPDLVMTGSVDGTLKVFHIGNKRMLVMFVHTSSDEATGGHGGEEAMDMDAEDEGGDEGQEGDDEKNGGMISNSIAVECVGFCHSDMPWVASGGMDHQLKVWDLNNGQLRLSCAHSAAVVSLSWHRTMPLVTTASLDHIVRIWDARNGNQVISLTGHSQPVTFVTSSPFLLNNQESQAELESIVSVADDSTARVFVLDLHKIAHA